MTRSPMVPERTSEAQRAEVGLDLVGGPKGASGSGWSALSIGGPRMEAGKVAQSSEGGVRRLAPLARRWLPFAIGALVAVTLAGAIGGLAGFKGQAEAACGWDAFQIFSRPHPPALEQLPDDVKEGPFLFLVTLLASVVLGGVALLRRRAHLLALAVLMVMALYLGGTVGRSLGWTTCPGEHEATTQPADLVIRFAAPYEAAEPTGHAGCSRNDRGGSVLSVGTAIGPGPEWTFADRHSTVLTVHISTDGSLGLSHSRYLQISLSDVEVHRSAIYSDGWGGTVEREMTPDGNSGTFRFTGLRYVPDEQFDAQLWPQTISGTVTWRCSGPER